MHAANVLRLIKALRDAVNDEADTSAEDKTPYVNEVLFHLDAAADVLEFPKVGSECDGATQKDMAT